MQMRLAAARPNGTPPAVMAISCGSRLLVTYPLEKEFRVYTVNVPTDCLKEKSREITLAVNGWSPADYGQEADHRVLGAVLDWVRIEAEQ